MFGGNLSLSWDGLGNTVRRLGERHTAANIVEWLEDVIPKFEIPSEKIRLLSMTVVIMLLQQ